jgi:MOSC domain-containing protein YiiM
MLNPNSTLAALLAAPINPGRVVWIGVRPARRAPIVAVESVIAEAGKGLVGDRHKTSTNGPRQVTLIQAEHLAAIASYLRCDSIDPGMLRRNIVVQGINLLAMKDNRFRIGGTLLEYTGECHPCSRMEENLGVGGYNAMRGHGGITARVLAGGNITVGDSIYVVNPEASVQVDGA